MKTYKGKYKIKNPDKYLGDPSNVIYRSGWELAVMNWADTSPQIKKWGSEETVIPDICETDRKPHRYFMDFSLQYDNGRVVLVEVKPHQQTLPPKTGKGVSRRKVLNEGMTYIKNQSKWKAAQAYALDNGWHFEIWTENELRAMGLLPKPMGKKPFKPLKKLKPYKRKK